MGEAARWEGEQVEGPGEVWRPELRDAGVVIPNSDRSLVYDVPTPHSALWLAPWAATAQAAASREKPSAAAAATAVSSATPSRASARGESAQGNTGGELARPGRAGAGGPPQRGSTVEGHYVGSLLETGAVFDSSRARGKVRPRPCCLW